MGKDECVVPTKHKKLTRQNLLVAKAGGHKNTNKLFDNQFVLFQNHQTFYFTNSCIVRSCYA